MDGFCEVFGLENTTKSGKKVVVKIMSREAGGGGDCFYHSIALLVSIVKHQQIDASSVKRTIAARVTEGNIVEILQGMLCSHYGPHERAAPIPEVRGHDLFDPVELWNTRVITGDLSGAVIVLRSAIGTRTGLYFWSNMDLLGLVEEAYELSVVVSSINNGKLCMARWIPGLPALLLDPSKVDETRFDYKPKFDTVFLLNHGNGHWTSMGILINGIPLVSLRPEDVINELSFLF